jgi:hypothetical protein
MYFAPDVNHNVGVDVDESGKRGRWMVAAQIEAREVSELEAVMRWRFDQLLRVGYDDDDAILLAVDLNVDLHFAKQLVLRGCPSDTAVRIAL